MAEVASSAAGLSALSNPGVEVSGIGRGPSELLARAVTWRNAVGAGHATPVSERTRAKRRGRDHSRRGASRRELCEAAAWITGSSAPRWDSGSPMAQRELAGGAVWRRRRPGAGGGGGGAADGVEVPQRLMVAEAARAVLASSGGSCMRDSAIGSRRRSRVNPIWRRRCVGNTDVRTPGCPGCGMAARGVMILRVARRERQIRHNAVQRLQALAVITWCASCPGEAS